MLSPLLLIGKPKSFAQGLIGGKPTGLSDAFCAHRSAMKFLSIFWSEGRGLLGGTFGRFLFLVEVGSEHVIEIALILAFCANFTDFARLARIGSVWRRKRCAFRRFAGRIASLRSR
jgi:hypothetical protein